MIVVVEGLLPAFGPPPPPPPGRGRTPGRAGNGGGGGPLLLFDMFFNVSMCGIEVRILRSNYWWLTTTWAMI